jgi:hypothetical protein
MSKRMKYDFDRLDKYCKENNVILLEDYSNVKLTKYTCKTRSSKKIRI